MFPRTPPTISITWLNIFRNTKKHFLIFVFSYFEAAPRFIALLDHFLTDLAEISHSDSWPDAASRICLILHCWYFLSFFSISACLEQKFYFQCFIHYLACCAYISYLIFKNRDINVIGGFVFHRGSENEIFAPNRPKSKKN